jgi:hypothetical protein
MTLSDSFIHSILIHEREFCEKIILMGSAFSRYYFLRAILTTHNNKKCAHNNIIFENCKTTQEKNQEKIIKY